MADKKDKCKCSNNSSDEKQIEILSGLSEKCDSSGIDFSGKFICLTGVFKKFKYRKEVEEYLLKKGATITLSPLRKTDYLIVGGKEIENWNYGNKVKKTLELQKDGFSIKILKEDEIW